MKSFVGIDWSKSKHNVVIQNAHGAEIAKKVIAHDAAGFATLGHLLANTNPIKKNCSVIIETDHNQLVDFLWDQQYPLYVVPPSVVKGNRSRQTTSRARNDDSDASLLADILRTDQGRLTQWKPDSHETRRIRSFCRLIDDLTTSIVRYHNRLEALLQRHYPQARWAFKDLTVPTWLYFLQKYPSHVDLDHLTYAAFESFCGSKGHRRRQYLTEAWATLQLPAPFASKDYLATNEIEHVAGLLLNLVQRKTKLLKSTDIVALQHADIGIFRSIPGVGILLSAKLLAMFGDNRDRWPTQNALQQVAGTCPATSESGTYKAVLFRRSCNHEFRNTMQQVAVQSIKYSDWAATYHANVFARSRSKSHAYRCLANRWLAIIWTLWQRRVPYDAATHMQHVALRRRN